MPALGGIASLLAYVVVSEGIVAAIDHFTGDPEGDAQRALQQLSVQQQVEAQGTLALEQEQREDLDKTFSKFNRIPGQILSKASLAQEDATAIRGNQPVDTGVLDFVSGKLNISPEDLSRRTSPGRLGDYTGVINSINKNIPGA